MQASETQGSGTTPFADRDDSVILSVRRDLRDSGLVYQTGGAGTVVRARRAIRRASILVVLSGPARSCLSFAQGANEVTNHSIVCRRT